MVSIAVVVGTRPEIVQAELIVREIHNHPEMRPVIIHSGQHYDYEMSRLFFQQLEVPEPDFHLGIGSGSHGMQTGKLLWELEAVLKRLVPSIVLVLGDTNSTLAAALAATKIRIPVGHVEAGLRSHNRQMAEEINRIVVDHISDLCFCPTENAVHNLAGEGITADVYRTGDVMFDSVIRHLEVIEQNGFWKKLGLQERQYAVATLHRAENTDAIGRLRDIVHAFRAIGEYLNLVIPLHPRTKKALAEYGLSLGDSDAIKVLPPVSYFDMLALVKHAAVVLTDSGGLQKQAFWLKTPCVTLRDQTEWIETVEYGWNVLISADAESISRTVHQLLDHPPVGLQPPTLFGDGNAAKKIIGLIRGKL